MQRCSDNIRFIMRESGFLGLTNYIDDLIQYDLHSKIGSAYKFLLQLLTQLGLPISETKLVPPWYFCHLSRNINKYT